jgi:hypothetical protein
MAKRSDKEYNCPYCSQTSSRRYNIRVHIQRKHPYYKHPYLQINNTNQFPVFNEPRHLTDFEKYPSNWNTPMEQPLPAFFPSPTFTFYPTSFFYDAKVKYEENERRESERRFNKTLFEYIQKMVIPALKLQNTVQLC